MNSEEKSFHQRLKEQRGELMDSCPYCGNTTQVYETPEGVIDCYRCGVNQTRTQTILRGEGKDREPITIKAEEPTLTQQVQDSFREDQRKGEKGGGSNGAKGRKKPVKRERSRVEQEPVFFNGSSGGSIVVKRKVERYTEAERIVLYVPPEVREGIKAEAKRRSRIDHTEWSSAKVVRYAMWDHLKRIDMVKPFEHGEDKVYLEVSMYPDEKSLLDEYRKEMDNCSRGEMVAACVEAFIEESF